MTMITITHMRPSTAITVSLLLIIAIAHLLRLFYQATVTVNTFEIPVWLSVPAVIITGGLAIWLWLENRKE
jgi:hypothetical protein